MLGDWQSCVNNYKYRSVKCVKPSGSGEGMSSIVRDAECQGDKPSNK